MIDVNYHEIGTNLLLVTVSVLIVLAGVEIGLRMTGEAPGEYPKYRYCTETAGVEFHAEYGWTLAANSEWWIKPNEYQDWEKYRTNSQGFRDIYDTGSNRVIVLGDSFSEGFLVGNNETYEYLLDRSAPQTTFSNYGVRNYGTAEQLAIYRNVSKRVDHELVIVGYYLGNDAFENTYDDPRRPRFDLVDGSLIQTNEPRQVTGRNESEGTEDRGLVTNPVLDGFQQFLSEHTATYPYLAPKVRNVLVRGGKAKKPIPPGNRSSRIELSRALLTEIADTAKEQEADVLLVSIPVWGDVNPSKPTHYRREHIEADWAAQRTMLKRVAQQNENVRILFLKPQLKEANRRGIRVYGVENGHLDDAGHRIVARTIRTTISELGYIEEGELGSPPNREELLVRCSATKE